MVRLRTIALAAIVDALASPLAALDFSAYSDLDFAERYAFATNRSALVGELQRGKAPWLFYSVLNAQTEGDIAAARKLLQSAAGDETLAAVRRSLGLRQAFFEWQQALIGDEQAQAAAEAALVRELELTGLTKVDCAREVPAAPNTYPPAIAPGQAGYEAFAKALPGEAWVERYDFLAAGQPGKDRPDICKRRLVRMPNEPGLVDTLVRAFSGPGRRYESSSATAGLTLAQFDELRRRGVKVNAAMIDDILARLEPGDCEDIDGEPRLHRAWLDRVLAFTATLGGEYRSRRISAVKNILEFERSRGNFGERRLLLEYLRAAPGRNGRGPCQVDDLIADYLAAFRREGDSLDDFRRLIDSGELRRIAAETDLLAGVDQSKVDLEAIGEGAFRQLCDRTEIQWFAGNPVAFAADDPVTLAVDVKNVAQMRVAIYEIDAFRAMCNLGGEIKRDIDLDGCVPTSETLCDYTRYPSVVRHRERLRLPQLDKPGVYVVECSGGGVSSRAVVRKGTLRVAERVESCGHVFTVMDEHGAPVKGARLQIAGAAYGADESGEITVPFAAGAAGESLAIVGAGPLAAVCRFNRRREEYALSIDAFLPSEAIVAGAACTALIAPQLTVAGAPASLTILEGVQIEAELTDLHGVGSVCKIEHQQLSDRGEIEVRFAVPEQLGKVRFVLRGRIRNLSQDRFDDLTAEKTLSFNGLLRTSRIEQALLRRDEAGYRIELRGRNGEALPARELRLEFLHRVFTRPLPIVLQTDDAGTVRLGALPGIDAVRLRSPFAAEWRIAADDGARLPYALTVKSGESVELRIPGYELLSNAWPRADERDATLTLTAINRRGVNVRDCTAAAAVDAGGVLRIDPLPAGRYLLYLRALDHAIDLRVAPCAVPADRARRLHIRAMRADSGEQGEPRRISVELANASPDARVHLVGRRYLPPKGDGDRLWAMLSRSRHGSAGAAVSLDRVRTDYISGRQLGDELRYILDRRRLPHRPGNMLDRPSLIVHSWSEQVTHTDELTVRDGEDWAADDIEPACKPRSESLRRSFSPGLALPEDPGLSCGFLAQNSRMWCNVRPNEAGVAVFELPAGLDYCDFVAVAVDGETADSRRLNCAAPSPALRDLRERSVAGGAPARSRAYTDLEAVFSMIAANSKIEHLDAFGFVVRWPTLSPERQRELYGEYACHELDVVLAFRDRPFFESVVLPGIKNKRRRDFIDHYLAGDDLSAWRSPAEWRGLNAFERCLLAQREPAVAAEIAAQLRQWCEAHPVDPATRDRQLLAVLGLAMSDSSVCHSPSAVRSPSPENSVAAFCAEEPVECEEPAEADMDMARGTAVALRRAAKRRGEIRQPYRPPEATREWLESGYYRRRPLFDSRRLAAPNGFWRDYAAAIAAGDDQRFLPQSIAEIVNARSLGEVMVALAVIDLPFKAAGDGPALEFADRQVQGDPPDLPRLQVLQQLIDPRRSQAGSPAYEREEFVAGQSYRLLTVVVNPEGRTLRAQLERQLPDGAIALAGGRVKGNITCELAPYGSYRDEIEFYFPAAGEGIGRLPPAVAAVDGKTAGCSSAFTCPVVAHSVREDRASWQWISQQGDNAAVLEFLRTANLESGTVELTKIGWRMADDGFARRVYDTLSSRGVFDPGLWRFALFGRGRLANFPAEVRELLMSTEVRAMLAPRLGPAFKCPLIEIEPEDAGLFEYAEFWPLINVRAHRFGGATAIANESLRRQYRRFLDLLATRRTLGAKDRLDAAVYLLAQDRVDEARGVVAGVCAGDVETRMQFDYLQAYFAFSDAQPEAAREIALKYADWPDGRWRERFGRMVAQADEIAGRATAAGQRRTAAETAPSLELSAVAVDGAVESVGIASRNVAECVLRAYRTDVEVAFSKQPFADRLDHDASALLKCTWQTNVAMSAEGWASVPLPVALRGANLLVEATDDEGRTSAMLKVLSGCLDVQLAAEYGELRVRDRNGRPLPGAYVKVYACDESGSRVKFHKDGYTDLRGAFEYAAVSSESDFRPHRLSILVLHDRAGAKTLVTRAPRTDVFRFSADD